MQHYIRNHIQDIWHHMYMKSYMILFLHDIVYDLLINFIWNKSVISQYDVVYDIIAHISYMISYTYEKYQ